jgi:hypothetical protein
MLGLGCIGNGPDGAGTHRGPAHRKVGTLPADTKSLAYLAHPATDESSCACYKGVVYIGHLVEGDGEEVEVFEAIPCRRGGEL